MRIPVSFLAKVSALGRLIQPTTLQVARVGNYIRRKDICSSCDIVVVAVVVVVIVVVRTTSGRST